MIGINSPLRNLPIQLDRDQAFFLDGMRHAAEICNLSYNRLTKGLAELSWRAEKDEIPSTYAEYYLDAWAFVDSCDKFIGLWTKQPNANTMPTLYSPDKSRLFFLSLRKIRNISDHLASNSKYLRSVNCAAFGVLSWINFFQTDPPIIKTYAISPGIMRNEFKMQLAKPVSIQHLVNGIGYAALKAGTWTADLSSSYLRIHQMIRFLETTLAERFALLVNHEVMPTDLFAKADLDYEGYQSAT